MGGMGSLGNVPPAPRAAARKHSAFVPGGLAEATYKIAMDDMDLMDGMDFLA
jgi:hypothetical protein